MDGKNMSKYNVYRSIIDKNIKKEFKDSDWCTSLMYYGTWQCKIDGLIAATYLFCPEIIEIEGFVQNDYITTAYQQRPISTP